MLNVGLEMESSSAFSCFQGAGWPLSTQAGLCPFRNLCSTAMWRVYFDYSSTVTALKAEDEMFS